MIMDIIRGLSSANLDIRKKTLEIMLDLIVPKNIGEVMQALAGTRLPEITPEMTRETRDGR